MKKGWKKGLVVSVKLVDGKVDSVHLVCSPNPGDQKTSTTEDLENLRIGKVIDLINGDVQKDPHSFNSITTFKLDDIERITDF